MNRKARRRLAKGERQDIYERLKQQDRDVRAIADNADELATQRGKDIASAVVATELLPMAVELVKEMFGADEAKAMEFGVKFHEKFTARVDSIDKKTE